MNDIQIFKNEQFGAIRTAGSADNPTFCLTDVCKILALDSSQVMKRLEDGVVSIHPIQDSLGRTQQANFVNEDGLYDVILDSRKPEAKAFRKWVTSEVLPSIRKHGMYATGATIESILQDPESAIKLLEAMNRERKERLAAQQEVERLEQKELENRPKIVYADAVEGSTSSCLIGELAKMIAQNGYQIGEKRLFQWLRDNHYLCAYGERFNQPYQQYIEQGLFTMKQNVFSVNGEMRTRNTTKVTGKGQIYFINKFLNAPVTQ